MIYIDPPYNTGKDFVYKDNYNDNLGNYLAITGQLDEEGKRINTQLQHKRKQIEQLKNTITNAWWKR